MESVDVVVIGAGITGLSAAWRLAVAGRNVVVLEQHTIGNSLGSSHGAVRIFRFAYPDPFYVRLAQAALPLWRELSGGEHLIRITGGIDAGRAEFVEPIVAALESCGAGVQRMNAPERSDRFPWLRAGDDPGVFSPDTGVIDAEAALVQTAAAARALGVRIFEETPVVRASAGTNEIVIETPERSMRARTAVVSAGGWAAPFLASLGIALPLRVTREQVMYFTGRTLPEIPFIHYGDVHRYGVPRASSAPGYKIGEHGTGREAVAGSAAAFTEPEASRLRSYVAGALPDLDPGEVASETCLYTSTASQDFVLDARDRVVVASPCSGHGFKFGPLTGEIVACIATGREPPVDTSRFALAAFS